MLLLYDILDLYYTQSLNHISYYNNSTKSLEYDYTFSPSKLCVFLDVIQYNNY